MLIREKRKNTHLELAKKRFSNLVDTPESVEFILVYRKVQKLLAGKSKELASLKGTLENLMLVLDNLGEALIITDSDGHVVFVNKSAKELSNKEEIKGRKLSEVIDNFYISDLLDETIKTGENQGAEITMYYPQKSVQDCQVTKVSFSPSEANFMVLLRDITSEKELELLRRDFVANVSHELRTPLTSIHGYAETLAEDSFEEMDTVRHFLKIIEDESARMTRLINDLLDLEKLESNNTILNHEEIELSEVGKYIMKIVLPLAEELGVNVYDDFEEGIYIQGDFDRLVQMILNLVDNSVKYTAVKEHGVKEVWVRIYSVNNSAILEIEDTGIGIPDESKKHLFERFYRVDKARSRKMGGTGLGLAIVHFILEKHHGTIDVDSEYGSGTIFKVKLPLKKVIQ